MLRSGFHSILINLIKNVTQHFVIQSQIPQSVHMLGNL